MSIVPDLPNAKFKRVLQQKVFTVTLGVSNFLTLLELPPHKFFLMSHMTIKNSQTLQIVPVFGMVIDGEAVLPIVATSSSVNQQILSISALQITTSAPSSITQLIPVRQKIVLQVDSTAVADGTITVDMWGYVLDDEGDIFNKMSSLSQ